MDPSKREREREKKRKEKGKKENENQRENAQKKDRKGGIEEKRDTMKKNTH